MWEGIPAKNDEARERCATKRVAHGAHEEHRLAGTGGGQAGAARSEFARGRAVIGGEETHVTADRANGSHWKTRGLGIPRHPPDAWAPAGFGPDEVTAFTHR